MKWPATRAERDELALILFNRMLSRCPVWVDSPMGQRVWIQSIGLTDDGEAVAFDHDGNDRLCNQYLLSNPHRSFESAS